MVTCSITRGTRCCAARVVQPVRIASAGLSPSPLARRSTEAGRTRWAARASSAGAFSAEPSSSSNVDPDATQPRPRLTSSSAQAALAA
eukprot:scaffold1182_cov124-Isochrysis_galbana.AAC.11